jgi:hypothetical protein
LTGVIFPTIILEKPSRGALNRFLQHGSLDAQKVFPDGSNLLHRLMRANHQNLETEY